MKELRCDMTKECASPITHIDENGWIYCAKHGPERRASGRQCRRLRGWEKAILAAGEALPSYQPVSLTKYLQSKIAGS